jgi:hypothetical protein
VRVEAHHRHVLPMVHAVHRCYLSPSMSPPPLLPYILQNMYFDAVEQILSKLADPKIKGSLKADLSRQLRDLDPDGAIRRFLEEGGERPNLSSAIQDTNKKR